jgi:hypothetical protein
MRKARRLSPLLFNFVTMSDDDDDTRRSRLTQGLEQLEARMGGPKPLAQLLHQALLGAVFPLATGQLVQLARENEAPRVLLTLLEGLPRREFDSLDAVQQALEIQEAEREGDLPAPPPLPGSER